MKFSELDIKHDFILGKKIEISELFGKMVMNYLNTDSDKREPYISEYNEMQEWRAKAKEIAKQVCF